MLTNYIILTLRNLRRNKGYAFINIFGLALGLTLSFFLLAWVIDELAFDRFHEKSGQLYRVMRNAESGNIKYTSSAVPVPLAEALRTNYPEVEHAILLRWNDPIAIVWEGQSFRESGFYASPAFFEMFSFPLLEGNAAIVVEHPDAIAISERLAEKFFGAEWRDTALGRTLTVDHRKDFTVTGVFSDPPSNSYLKFDYVLPVQDFVDENARVNSWDIAGMQLFVQMREGANGEMLTQRIADLITEHDESQKASLFLQPYTDMYLYSDYRDHKLVGGRIEYVRIFTMVAVFVLLIAAINFMNLSTARSMQRVREIGVRKVMGARRENLFQQFMGESLVIAGMAAVLAILLVEILMPFFNDLTGKSAGLIGSSPRFLLMFLSITLVTGLLAGSYPALVLSSFSPLEVLHGRVKQRPTTATLRKGLVVAQFSLSILLIVGTLAVHSQIEYIRGKNLGLDRENIITMPLEGPAKQQYEAFKHELMQQPGISAVSSTNQSPLSIGNSTDEVHWDGKQPGNNTLFHVITADHDFVETMRMELISGRTFSEEFGRERGKVIINEQAARAMGMEEPVDQHFQLFGGERQIVGVVKDFHMASLHKAIEPTIIWPFPGNSRILYVRAEPGRAHEALAGLETVHRSFNSSHPFEYEFLDSQYERAYQNELLMGKLANIFTLVALFISALGLFGLASFTTQRRTKEIGIRKVLGASVSGIVGLLSMQFLKLVLIAFVLATPLAHFAIGKWLERFTYQVEIGVGTFVVAAAAMMLVALFTVIYQSIRAALSDPVKALRYE